MSYPLATNSLNSAVRAIPLVDSSQNRASSLLGRPQIMTPHFQAQPYEGSYPPTTQQVADHHFHPQSYPGFQRFGIPQTPPHHYAAPQYTGYLFQPHLPVVHYPPHVAFARYLQMQSNGASQQFSLPVPLLPPVQMGVAVAASSQGPAIAAGRVDGPEEVNRDEEIGNVEWLKIMISARSSAIKQMKVKLALLQNESAAMATKKRKLEAEEKKLDEEKEKLQKNIQESLEKIASHKIEIEAEEALAKKGNETKAAEELSQKGRGASSVPSVEEEGAARAKKSRMTREEPSTNSSPISSPQTAVSSSSAAADSAATSSHGTA